MRIQLRRGHLSFPILIIKRYFIEDSGFPRWRQVLAEHLNITFQLQTTRADKTRLIAYLRREQPVRLRNLIILISFLLRLQRIIIDELLLHLFCLR
jgi:hypothetical protein